MKLKRAVIIGMGLIGGSIGKALLKKGLADEVIGVCRRQSSLDRAVKENSLTGGFVNDLKDAVKGADIVFIATPVGGIKDMLEKLASVVSSGKTIVTDVGSTKSEIVDAAAAFKEKYSFVGGHPLAGSERAGVEYSRADLFEGSCCILTRGSFTKEEDIETLRGLWQALGADVDIVTPKKHDEILSYTSHLPHVIAYSLVGTQTGDHAKYTSTGFKDTTRIAMSDQTLWSDIFMSNREDILKAIEKFKESLADIEKDIRENSVEELNSKLKKYRDLRNELN